jgi:hypothetical protein
LIENGYDESAFVTATNQLISTKRTLTGPFVLVHSGLIYASERDPTHFFAALGRLLRDGSISPSMLQIVLRASGSESYLQGLIIKAGIDSVVTLAPAIPYIEALQEMLNADALLVLQASNCNDQVPAKLYEYMRSRRPILGLTDPAGDTANALRSAGIDTIARLDSEECIVTTLKHFLQLLRTGKAPVARDSVIRAASRRSRTLEFAELLNRVAIGSSRAEAPVLN